MELAILGLLIEAPMHGYELRKRLFNLLGAFRAFSYGSLYPSLKKMSKAGLIEENMISDKSPLPARKAKRIYSITKEGKNRFTELTNNVEQSNFSDDQFSLHLAFFDQTTPAARLRILEGRRRLMEQRRENLQQAQVATPGLLNRYTSQLHKFKIEATEQELSWINQMINTEQHETSNDNYHQISTTKGENINE